MAVDMQVPDKLTNRQIFRLWSGPAPGAFGEAETDVPTLQVCLPPSVTAPGPACVVLPGGGYQGLAPHEGEPVGDWLASLGLTAFVLRYRLGPRYHHPIQLGDAQRAIRTVRANAGAWGLDPARIAILGFSAGGHLASTAATHFDTGQPQSADPVERVSSRPDAHILVYPVISMGAITHGGSRTNLLGPNPPAHLIDLLSNEKQVTAHTPPAFLMHSVQDQGVSVAHSDLYTAALTAAGVEHCFVRGTIGPHGIGMHPCWTKACGAWLRNIGF